MIINVILFCIFSSKALSSELKKISIKRPDGSQLIYYVKRSSLVTNSDTLLFIAQGSDCNSVVHSKGVNDLSYFWPSADLLLIEKYGITSELSYIDSAQRSDCPDAYLKGDNINQRIRDVIQVLNQIKYTKNYKQFLTIGGSEGATVVIMVASRIKYIDATVAISVGGQRFIDDVVHSIKYGNEDTPELQKQIRSFYAFAQSISKNPNYNLNVSNHGYLWWKQMLELDQVHELLKVNSPILLTQSSNDASVSAEGADKMIETLRNKGKKNVYYKKYSRLDHRLKDSSGQSHLVSVAQDINCWFREILKHYSKECIHPTADRTR